MVWRAGSLAPRRVSPAASRSIRAASICPEAPLDNRRLFLAALLSLAVLFGWQALFPPPEAPPRPPLATAEPPASPPPTSASPTPASAVAATPEPAADLAPIAAALEEEVAIESGDVVARLTNRGGLLTSLRLRSAAEGQKEGIELVQGRPGPPYPLALVGEGGESLPINAALFAVERASEAGIETVRLRHRGPDGDVDKQLRFLPSGLIEIEVTARSLPTWGVAFGPGLRRLNRAELDNRFERRAGAWLAAGKVETLAPNDVAAPRTLGGAEFGWVGLEDTYFLTAFVPKLAAERAVFFPVLLEAAGDERSFRALPRPAGDLTGAQKELPRDLTLALFPRGERLALSSFWGAKQYDRLASFSLGLEKSVQWGIFGFLSRPLLWGLQAIVPRVGDNWGWAIVVMTAILKVLLLPLTLTAMVSMQKMQRLNPKMQAIRERWRPKLRDKQGRFNAEAQRQMNEEVMALYKAEGVNPAGGCLPMLLQIPVFFAFYSLLSTAVELWHTPWLGWIRDLSAPDPYYVLPLLMGATQYVQQRMTPQAPDPIQRRIFQLFPVIFTVFSLGFPSGLVLYWLVNNVLTIGQQAGYNRWKANREAREAAAKPAAKGKEKR